MSKRLAASLLALVLVLACAGAALASGAATSGNAANGGTPPARGPKMFLPDMTNFTDEQKAAVQAKLDTLKSIQEQIRALDTANARNRVKAAIGEIEKAEAANDSATVDKLWGEIGKLARFVAGPGKAGRWGHGHHPMMRKDGTNPATNPSAAAPNANRPLPGPKGPRGGAWSAIHEAKDYDSLMAALDKAIAEAQARLDAAKAGQLPSQPAPDGQNKQ